MNVTSKTHSIHPDLNINTYFPEELLLHLFSFFDPQTLLQASYVNRKWNLLSKDESLWKRVYNQKLDDETLTHSIHPHSIQSTFRNFTIPALRLEHCLKQKPTVHSYEEGVYRLYDGAYLDRAGDIGYLEKEDNIHIISLKNMVKLGNISVSPLRCFSLPNNQLLILTRAGILEYWDLLDITSPCLIKKVELKIPHVDVAFKIKEYLILIEIKFNDSPELHIFDLAKEEIIQSKAASKITGLYSDEENFLVELTDKEITGYSLNEKGLVHVWSHSIENEIFSDYFHPFIYHRAPRPSYIKPSKINPLYPYIYYLEQTDVSTLATITHAHDGKKLLQIAFPKQDFHLRGSSFSLMADGFFFQVKDGVHCWMIPSGLSFKFKNIEDCVWDGQTLAVYHRSNRREAFHCYGSKKQEKESENEKRYLSRSYFLKLVGSNLLQTIPATVRIIIDKICELVFLHHFWGRPNLSFPKRFKAAIDDLEDIICLPLLAIGRELVAIAGIASPSLAEPMLIWTNKKFLHFGGVLF